MRLRRPANAAAPSSECGRRTRCAGHAWRLPTIIRGFREAASGVDISLIEVISLRQIGALKEGLIGAGFYRVRFGDPSVRPGHDVLLPVGAGA